MLLVFRLSTVDSGSLLISEVQASDGKQFTFGKYCIENTLFIDPKCQFYFFIDIKIAGKYECSAQSMAGSKTAPAAMLKVLAPPTVVRRPQDTEEVIEGEGLDLACDVSYYIFSMSIYYTYNIHT